jgi:hypothetical protein
MLPTYLRFQYDTALYPLPRLISSDWTSPYELCAWFVYSPLFHVKYLRLFCIAGNTVCILYLAARWRWSVRFMSIAIECNVRRAPEFSVDVVAKTEFLMPLSRTQIRSSNL